MTGDTTLKFPDEVLAADEIRLLAEIGFMACGAGHARAARNLFEGLRVLRPRHAFPYIGLALARLGAGAYDEAVRILRDEGLAANPGNDEIQVFLGLALNMAKRPSESARVLEEVLKKAVDESPEVILARRLLGQHGGASPEAPAKTAARQYGRQRKHSAPE
jgi:predicted Zn-dependent protease